VLHVAATSTFLDPADMERAFRGELEGCYLYSRHLNPSVTAFGRKLAALEGAEAALGVASGMAAVSCALERLCESGDHIVCSRSVYGGTYALLANLFPRRGIRVSFVDVTDFAAVEKAFTPRTRVLYAETLSNPLLEVADLPTLAKIARSKGASLVVDNTFTPLVARPLEHGADVVLYSATKYLSGGSDMIAGAVVGRRDFVSSLVDVNSGPVMLNGPVMDARVAHELYLRLDHLPLRMQAHGRSALFFAKKAKALGVKVLYPGLEGHPGRELLTSLGGEAAFGAGGVVTIDAGSPDRARRLASALQKEKFGLYAVSLGFSRTLMSCPSLSTSSEIPEAERDAMGLGAGLLRLSLGYTGRDETQWERFEACWHAL
jgi:methionine-gamma-lyase